MNREHNDGSLTLPLSHESLEAAWQCRSFPPLPRWPADRFQLVRRLQGAIYGGVYEMRDLLEKQAVCVKVLLKTELASQRGAALLECPKRELAIYWQLKEAAAHGQAYPEHVAELLDAFEDEERVYFVMRYYDLGELFAHAPRVTALPEAVALSAHQLLKACASLHARGIAHRDISLENLWLHSDGNLRLGDFGQAVRLNGRGMHEEPIRDTAAPCAKEQYRPPEVQLQHPYLATKVDMYCAGVAIFALAFGSYPAEPYAKHGLGDDHVKGCFPSDIFPTLESLSKATCEALPAKMTGLLATLSDELRPAYTALVDLLAHLLAPQPCCRPDAATALRHPFFHHFAATRPEGEPLELPAAPAKEAGAWEDLGDSNYAEEADVDMDAGVPAFAAHDASVGSSQQQACLRAPMQPVWHAPPASSVPLPEGLM